MNEEIKNEKFLKFGRCSRIVFSSTDMYIEEYVEKEVEDKKTGEVSIKKQWDRVTGYYGSVKQLLESYTNKQFIRKSGSLDEFKAVLEEILDAIEKIPNYILSRFHKCPVIVEERTIKVSQEMIDNEKKKKLMESGVKIVKAESNKKPKKKRNTNKKSQKEEFELF